MLSNIKAIYGKTIVHVLAQKAQMITQTQIKFNKEQSNSYIYILDLLMYCFDA